MGNFRMSLIFYIYILFGQIESRFLTFKAKQIDIAVNIIC